MVRTLISIATALLIAGFLIDKIIVDWLTQQADDALLSKARVLVTLTKDLEEGIDFDFADEFMPEFEAEINPEYYQIWVEGEGTIEKSNSLADDLPLMPFTHIHHDFLDLVLPDGRLGRMVQVVFIPQIPDPTQRTQQRLSAQKKVTLVTAQARDNLRLLIFEVHASLLSGLGILLGFAAAQIWLVVKTGLKPLRSIQEQLSSIDEKSLEQRIKLKDSPKELLLIVEQFNNLMGSLEESFSREQRFTSDVAHELKTPVTELRILAEVANTLPNEADHQQFYQDILDASKQMENTVKRLFDLARCEKGSIILDPKVISLNSCLRQTLSKYSKNMESKRQTLTESYSDNIEVLSSEDELVLILNNLIDNAITYGCMGDTIVCSLSEDPQKGIVFCLTNTADNLSQTDLPYLFDRMWQKDSARSGDHAGLGLALVRAYVDLLTLTVFTNLSDDNRFTICIYGFKKS